MTGRSFFNCKTVSAENRPDRRKMHKENDAPVSAYAEGDSGIVLATQGTEPFCNK